MLTNKNITSLLLVALIATTAPAQAGLSDSLKDLLARMQNNSIARQITAKRVGYVALGAGAIATTVGLWLWLKNRASVAAPSVDLLRGQQLQSNPSSSSSSSIIPSLTQDNNSLLRSATLSAVRPQAGNLGEASGPRAVEGKKEQAEGVSFFEQKNMGSWQELPDILQAVLGNDLSKVAIALDYDGTLVHDVYTLSNGKIINLLLYEKYNVKPDLFEKIRKEVNSTNPVDLVASCVLKSSKIFTNREKDDFIDAYYEIEPDITLPSVYMEDKMKPIIINHLVKKAAFVGICSRTVYSNKRGEKVAGLGVMGDEAHWCYVYNTKFNAFNNFIKAKKDNKSVSDKVDTYVLIDNDQSNVKKFVEQAKEAKINALGIYYTLVDDTVTENALRKEISFLSPDCYPVGAGIGSDE